METDECLKAIDADEKWRDGVAVGGVEVDAPGPHINNCLHVIVKPRESDSESGPAEPEVAKAILNQALAAPSCIPVWILKA